MVGKECWDDIASDILDLLDDHYYNSKKPFYILNIIDRYSGRAELILIQNIRAKTISSSIKKYWLKRHPCSKSLLTDRGR